MKDRLRVVNVVGARPNLVKMAPIVREMERQPELDHLLLHTGQHYDYEMSQVFFDELGLPQPQVYFGVGSGSHATQTAKVMVEFETFAQEWRPDLVLVVGDVNSTLACSVTAAKMNIPIAHVEAGLRSFDRTMPEEINRIVTDALSTLLFITSRDAADNLIREGVPANQIFFVGNVMIDTLLLSREKAAKSTILNQLQLRPGRYLVLTLHRPSNVDDPQSLAGLLSMLDEVQRSIPILFPVHPRTLQHIQLFGLADKLAHMPGLILTKPLSYLDFVHAMSQARGVLTDSGGIQEETTILGVPCLTLRNNTERPVTVTQGSNKVVGTDPEQIRTAIQDMLASPMPGGRVPELWDGHAGRRIVATILEQARNWP